MDLRRKELFKEIRSYVIIVIGLFINSLGWTAFLLPSKITGGGVSGIGALLYYVTGFPVGITYLLVNVLLIVAAIVILGSKFGVKTVVGILLVSLFLSLFQRLISVPVVGDSFLSAIIGGVLAGAGIGIAFTQGGSTGGTDIIALIINKYRNITPGKVILALDILIIGSSWFVFHSLEKIVYGYVTMAVTAYTIDLVLEGSKQSVQVFVFSKNPDQIADSIGNELNRGITLVKGQGWYSKSDTDIILVVLKKHEVQELLRIVKRHDPQAFISVGNVMGVYGKGFDRIKL